MTHFRLKRYHNKEWIDQTTIYLQIENYYTTTFSSAVKYLKEAKKNYLQLKAKHQQLRDEYANILERANFKQLQYKEKVEMKWKRLK